MIDYRIVTFKLKKYNIIEDWENSDTPTVKTGECFICLQQAREDILSLWQHYFWKAECQQVWIETEYFVG